MTKSTATQWKWLDITNLYITRSSLGIRMTFFTPVIVKYMKNNVHITEPRYHEQILPVPLALRYIDVPLYLKSMLKKLKQQQRFRLRHLL